MTAAWTGAGIAALGALLCALAPSLVVVRTLLVPVSPDLGGIVPWVVGVAAPLTAAAAVVGTVTVVRRRRGPA